MTPPPLKQEGQALRLPSEQVQCQRVCRPFVSKDCLQPEEGARACMCGYLHACVCMYVCVCVCVLICIFLLPRLETDHVILSISASPPPRSTPAISPCSGPQLVLWLTGLAIGARQQDAREVRVFTHTPQPSLQVPSGWLCLPLFSLCVPLLPSSVAALSPGPAGPRDAVTSPRALPQDPTFVKGSSTVLVSYCCSNKLPHLVA